MSIWLWAVVFLTWCAFLWIVSSIRQFRVLVMKNEMLDRELRHAKKRLLRAENDLVSQDIHIKEQSEVLNEWVEALNEWKEAHDQLEKDFDRLLSVSEEWFELDIVDRRQYDSLAEVDDLLLQTTTKEFIRLMGWHRANKVKARRPVVTLNTKKDIKESVELAQENFKKIKYHFSAEGLGDIQSLIEVEKDKFLNEEERNTSLS